MEKYARFRIFSIVNPDTEYYRNLTRTHNLDELLDFLVEVVNSNPLIRAQVKDQLDNFVLGGIRFGKLHNDLRYPIYSEKYRNYSMLKLSREDAEITLDKLEKLKLFLRDLDRLRRV